MANWLVQDGKVPELHPGAVLRNVALRAASSSLQESSETEGVKDHPGTGHDSELGLRYDTPGTGEAAGEPGSVILRVGTFRVLAEPDRVRQVGEEGALERHSPDFAIPAVGTRVTANCTLEVMAAYETDDRFLGVPVAGLARDWQVERIQLARRALTPTPGQRGDYSVGPLLDLTDIPRIHRWGDDSQPDTQHVAYLLDLHAT